VCVLCVFRRRRERLHEHASGSRRRIGTELGG
jgi:hypothetical protein